MDVNNDHFMTNIAKLKTMVNANLTLETVQLPAPDILQLRYTPFTVHELYAYFSAISSYDNTPQLKAAIKELFLSLKTFVILSTKWMMKSSF